MDNQAELTDYLVATGILQQPHFIEAFQAIDRADFVGPSYDRQTAYLDDALPIAAGQTISQPTTVAFMLERLDPQLGEKILDVGAGSGWTTALLANVVGPTGRVYGVERITELVRFGQNNLEPYHFPWATIEQAGATYGKPDKAPFDRILTSAAADELPTDLVKQLKVGGRLVIPIQNSIWQIDKLSATETASQEFPGFVFVPLRTEQA